MVWAFGIPTGFIYLLYKFKERGKAGDKKARDAFGWMYEPFRRDRELFFGIEMVRVLLLTSFVGFVAQPVNFLQNTISDRTHCIAQLRLGSSFLLSVLRFLDRNHAAYREYEHPARKADGAPTRRPWEFLKMTEYVEKITKTKGEMKAERKRVRARKRLNAKAARKAERVAAHKIALSQWRRDAFQAETRNERPPERPATPPSEDDAAAAGDDSASDDSEGDAAAEAAAGDFADEADILSMNYGGRVKVDKLGMMNPNAAFKFTSSVTADTPPGTRKARREGRAWASPDGAATPTGGAKKDAAGIAKREAAGQDNPLAAYGFFKAGDETQKAKKKERVKVPLLGGGLFSSRKKGIL